MEGWSHSYESSSTVLSCHRNFTRHRQVNMLRLAQLRKAGIQFAYPGGIDSWVERLQ